VSILGPATGARYILDRVEVHPFLTGDVDADPEPQCSEVADVLAAPPAQGASHQAEHARFGRTVIRLSLIG
jgi:hypothetical protein